MAKAQAQEPSMEEILASIRRIIADDEPRPEPKAAPAPAADTVSEDDLDRLFAKAEAADEPDFAEAAEDEPLELGDEFAEVPEMVEALAPEEEDITFTDPPPPPPPRMAEVRPEPVVEARSEPRPEPRVESRPPPRVDFARAEMPAEDPLLSRATDTAVQSAFNNLALTIMSNQARTLEDLVKEMLRPMLKSWLDDNLPTLVERLVRAEIERVSRGR